MADTPTFSSSTAQQAFTIMQQLRAQGQQQVQDSLTNPSSGLTSGSSSSFSPSQFVIAGATGLNLPSANVGPVAFAPSDPATEGSLGTVSYNGSPIFNLYLFGPVPFSSGGSTMMGGDTSGGGEIVAA